MQAGDRTERMLPISDGPMELTIGQLRVVHNAIERLVARIFAGPISEDYAFELEATEHWIVVGIHGRTFGFWRATMAMYEADEHGAMGDEEVMP